MKQFRSAFRTLMLAGVLAAAMPAAGFAHNLWLNATDFAPKISERTGAATKMYFGFGHQYPVQDFLGNDRLTEFNLVKPDGSVQALEAEEGGFMATPLILKNKGAHMVTAATKTGFYTMYFENGSVHHKMGSMEGLENIILSLYYENWTKALINVGQTEDDAFATPVGHNIEIVPLENPYLKAVGDTLKVQVLYQGRPASFCDVNATYVGFSTGEDYAFSNKTGSNGISTLRLLAPGQWIVRAVVRKPAADGIKDKCIEEKYSATISFGVR